jgi:hypothetical protein
MGSIGPSSNPNDVPEYETTFTEGQYTIVHRHYTDRQEYDIYDGDELVDTAESTNELAEIIRDLRRNN